MTLKLNVEHSYTAFIYLKKNGFLAQRLLLTSNGFSGLQTVLVQKRGLILESAGLERGPSFLRINKCVNNNALETDTSVLGGSFGESWKGFLYREEWETGTRRLWEWTCLFMEASWGKTGRRGPSLGTLRDISKKALEIEHFSRVRNVEGGFCGDHVTLSSTTP